MAIVIPTISSCSEKITAGEKRLARLLEGGSAICAHAGMIPEWGKSKITQIL
jgi:hypothetical protein